MALVFACIAPHGFPIIPALSEDAEGALATRAAMEDLGRRCAAARPDVLVVAGPHGVRVDGAVCLAHVARAAGTLTWEGRRVEMNVPVDRALTEAIAGAAKAEGVPVALAGYAGNRVEQSAIPLDWGTLTPLWFLAYGRDMPGKGDVLADPPETDDGPTVAIATPSRSLPPEAMLAFGRAVAAAAESEGRRVAFVASCDWAHTHRADGPYGAHPAAAEMDGQVVSAVRDNDLSRLLGMDQRLIGETAMDGWWQTLMLAGVAERVPLRAEVLCYEAPSYYGMLVAAFERVG